jgi:hypothetical protein
MCAPGSTRHAAWNTRLLSNDSGTFCRHCDPSWCLRQARCCSCVRPWRPRHCCCCCVTHGWHIAFSSRTCHVALHAPRSAEAARDKAEAGRRAAERRAKQAEEDLAALKDRAQASANQVGQAPSTVLLGARRPRPCAPSIDVQRWRRHTRTAMDKWKPVGPCSTLLPSQSARRGLHLCNMDARATSSPPRLAVAAGLPCLPTPSLLPCPAPGGGRRGWAGRHAVGP